MKSFYFVKLLERLLPSPLAHQKMRSLLSKASPFAGDFVSCNVERMRKPKMEPSPYPNFWELTFGRIRVAMVQHIKGLLLWGLGRRDIPLGQDNCPQKVEDSQRTPHLSTEKGIKYPSCPCCNPLWSTEAAPSDFQTDVHVFPAKGTIQKRRGKKRTETSSLFLSACHTENAQSHRYLQKMDESRWWKVLRIHLIHCWQQKGIGWVWPTYLLLIQHVKRYWTGWSWNDNSLPPSIQTLGGWVAQRQSGKQLAGRSESATREGWIEGDGLWEGNDSVGLCAKRHKKRPLTISVSSFVNSPSLYASFLRKPVKETR